MTPHRRIFAQLGFLLADEPALKEMLAIKGHAGTKPCILCINATLYKTPAPMHTLTEHAVPITETKLAAFQLHTTESIREMVRKLKVYKTQLSNDQFQIREQVYGLSLTPHSPIAHVDPRLHVDPATQVMYDWVHITVSDGVADVEFGMFMRHMHMERTGEQINTIMH